MVLSCESYDARPLTASHFDAERGCFEQAVMPDGLCAVPSFCPTGNGVTTCIADRDGEVYLAFVQWGEELSAGWRHDEGARIGQVLTSRDQAKCEEIYSARDEAAGEEGEPVMLGMLALRPACAE
jgi:hypothetical protein